MMKVLCCIFYISKTYFQINSDSDLLEHTIIVLLFSLLVPTPRQDIKREYQPACSNIQTPF